MKPKRIIFISDFAANYSGNFLQSSKKLSEFLKRKGIKSIYFFPKDAKGKVWNDELKEYEVIYLDFESEEFLEYLNKIVKRGDLIYSNFINRKTMLKIRKIKRRFKKNIKVIYHERMDLHYTHLKILKPLYNFYFRTMFKDFIIVANSPAVYKRICEKYGKSNAVVVENGIELSRLDSFKNFVLPKERKKNIYIFGSDYYRKAVDIAIRAINNSKIKNKVTLKIIVHDISKTKDIIKQEFGKIPSFIELCPTEQDIKKVYDNCMIFLSPSRYEAFGNAVVEAAYCGSQVIASDVTGQDTLKNIPYIKWVMPNSVEDLTHLVEVLYSQPSIMSKKQIEKVQQVIKQNYSLKNWTEKMYNIFVR